MKSVLKELGAFKKQVLLIVLTVLGTTMCTLGLPSLLMILIDNAIPNKDIVLVLEVGGIMLLLVVMVFYAVLLQAVCLLQYQWV